MPFPSIYLTNLWLLGQIFHHLLSPIRGIFTLDGNGDSTRQRINAVDTGLRFEGNTTLPDYFKLLERDGRFLLVGARNVVYNISMDNFDVQMLIFWPSLEQDVEMCLMKGKSKDDCHNYIRILAKEDKNGLLVCGTNAFKPTCRRYKHKAGAYEVIFEFSALGTTPYDPSHQSTAFYMPDTMEIYAGTVADFSATDALISRCHVGRPEDLGLRTERSDINCLNDPAFVSSMADSDHVYFWLREDAVEFSSCGKATYSRVAQVCKKDRGGPRTPSSSFWTSFAKLRLNCSLSGDFPFYFDKIVATSNIVRRLSPADLKMTYDESEFVYAVFDTPYNSALGGSAVCAYSMKEIREAFLRSPFKAQWAQDSSWQSVPRPVGVGDCNINSQSLSPENMNFVRKNFLLDTVLPNYFTSPLLVQTGARRFTKITVDPQVQSVDGQRYDVIFLSTNDGKIVKAVNLIATNSRFLHDPSNGDQPSRSTVTIEIIKIFDQTVSVNNMQILRPNSQSEGRSDGGQLIVVSDELVRAMPLHYCSRSPTCHSCVHLQDPYCAWDPDDKACVASTTGWDDKKYIQNVSSGFSRLCFDADSGTVIDNPSLEIVNELAIKNLSYNANINAPWIRCDCPSKSSSSDNAKDNHGSYVSSEKIASIFLPGANKHSYSVENLIFAVLTASFTSCLVGFLIGLRLGKNTVCWPPFLAKLGAKKCHSPVLNGKGPISESKPKKAINRLFSIKSKQNSSTSNGPINAYEYDPPKIGDYRYLNESSAPSSASNSLGTPSYCNKAYWNSSSPCTESTLHSANPSSPDCVDVALSSVPTSYCTDTVSTTAYSNYCSTLPKDYRVKKTYL